MVLSGSSGIRTDRARVWTGVGQGGVAFSGRDVFRLVGDSATHLLSTQEPVLWARMDDVGLVTVEADSTIGFLGDGRSSSRYQRRQVDEEVIPVSWSEHGGVVVGTRPPFRIMRVSAKGSEVRSAIRPFLPPAALDREYLLLSTVVPIGCGWNLATLSDIRSDYRVFAIFHGEGTEGFGFEEAHAVMGFFGADSTTGVAYAFESLPRSGRVATYAVDWK